MSKFDAGIAVERLEYDFTAFGGTAGVIPEPSTGTVQTFFDTLQALASEIRGKMAGVEGKDLEEISEEEAADVVAQMDDNIAGEYQTKMNAAIAELCGGTPSLEEISGLPFRVLGAFTQWLTGELNPNRTPAASKR
jgi:hypothetical protein